MKSENDKTGFNKYSILMFLISYNNPIRFDSNKNKNNKNKEQNKTYFHEH